MNIATKSIIAACLVTLPSFAFAQDTTQAETTTAEDTTTTAISETLSTGTPVEQRVPTRDEVAAGEEYLMEVSGDWELRCAKNDAGKDPCQMYQLLNNVEGPFAEISIFPIPKGEAGAKAVAGATIITPLDTMLAPGILITVDSANGRRYPYSFCGTMGCIGRIGFLAEDIAAYKRGNVASLQIVPAIAPDKTATASISLKGFTAAYDKLLELQTAN